MKYWSAGNDGVLGSLTQYSNTPVLHHSKRWPMLKFSILVMFFVALSGASVDAAQTSFYQGKTIRIVVGNLPGDTHDLFARAYSRSMANTSPAIPQSWSRTCPAQAR